MDAAIAIWLSLAADVDNRLRIGSIQIVADGCQIIGRQFQIAVIHRVRDRFFQCHGDAHDFGAIKQLHVLNHLRQLFDLRCDQVVVAGQAEMATGLDPARTKFPQALFCASDRQHLHRGAE